MADPARFSLVPVKPVDVVPLLEALTAPQLKTIAAGWTGRSVNAPKHECLRIIREGMDDPVRLRRRVQDLTEVQRGVLGLLKNRHGESPTIELALEGLTLGFPVTAGPAYDYSYRYSYGQSSYYAAFNEIAATGFVIQAVDYPRYATPQLYREEGSVLATLVDHRVLPCLEPVAPLPLPLEATEHSGGGSWRAPAEVTLRLVALMDALRQQGAWELTVKSRAPKSVVTRLERVLKWNKAAAESEFKEPTFFYFQWIQALGLVDADDSFHAGLSPDAESVLELPLSTQARLWANAYQSMTGWVERTFPQAWVNNEELYQSGKYNALRAMLSTGLAALPDPGRWYRASDFISALEGRVGEHFSFQYRAPFYPPYSYGRKAVDPEEARTAWRAGLRGKWLREEGEWIRAALQGPLYELGFVEVVQASSSHDLLFRLTSLGHDALYNRLRPGNPDRLAQVEAQDAPDAWIVQPNGDVVVYLDRATARQLSFLARVAQRQGGTGTVATYRLSRESVYAGLERGLTVGEVRAGLEKGSAQPLAPGLRRNLDDWAARREKLAVYPLAEVLQFPNAAARDQALSRREVEGEAIGDVFVRLTKPLKRTLLKTITAIDYRQPPPRCWRLTETGEVTLRSDLADIFARAELANWAEPGGAPELWRVTRASVERAILAGWDADRILQRLSERAIEPPRPLLVTTIRNWARKRAVVTAALARQLVLQFPDATAAEAVWGSGIFSGRLAARLGPCTFLVREEDAEALRSALGEHGFWVAEDLSLAAPRR